MHSRERKPVVLSTVPYYLPGFKGGGKLVTIRNLVAALGNQFHFKVMTADRDLGDSESYRGHRTKPVGDESRLARSSMRRKI